ncbi:general transcription factor 3C polypeptide 3 isoform X1 [Olea europaea subsp. europaea]|uniref:General transcription factor 3C polypeptide 3 isoform X1 n=1 Tax=Olea europaea subsp. europaea TaxID=158383 RepID=A0A8S0U9Z4_OLEEU|nr:general transcription factor 3C polypeptide 3 isoform X1 [Olea europaea subsp. europaea]
MEDTQGTIAMRDYCADELPLELGLEEEEEDNDNDDDGDGENNGASEEEDEQEYGFRFQGEMNPLAFVEEHDAAGLQPYERFEQVQYHYEALAAKKHNTPASPHYYSRETPAKRLRQEEIHGASFEEIMEAMNYGMRRKSKKTKKKGRRKGSKKKINSELTRKLGDATLHYAHGRYEEAISDLNEVILLAPNLSDPYHTLGLIYNEMGDKKRALNFYMIAAHLTPKDASLWKLLVTWSIELDNKRQANYCLSKAITADPEDINLQFHRASIYVELGEYHKAAESYEQISRLCPDNIEVLKTATQLYQKCGQHERAIYILEDYLTNHVNDADLSMVDLLASVHMEGKAHDKALEHIKHAQQVYCAEKDIPLHLLIKSGICHAHLRQTEKAETIFSVLQQENACTHPHLIIEVADSLMTVEQYESALKYYTMLDGDGNKYNGYLHLKIAKCYVSLRKRVQAIEYFYRAIHQLDDSVDARLTLSSLLLEEGRDDEAISVLSPQMESESALEPTSRISRQWWLNGKIKLKLSQIYKAKGSFEAFVDVIFPVIRETLFLETYQQKVKARKRLSTTVLHERVKVLDDHQTGNVFQGFKPLASAAELSKASRAKRLLRKKATIKEEKKAAALAAGIDWKSDDSDDECPQDLREPPLPVLLKNEEHHHLIIDLCKSLSALQRYWDALQIINLCLKLACNTLSPERKEDLRTLGAQVAYNISDPAHGWDCVRYIVSRHPYSFSAWNCYYKVMSRMDNRYSKHNKFLHNMRVKHKDSVPPIMISAHMFTMISQHQAAAREYLEAYRLMPDSPLINLCVDFKTSISVWHKDLHSCLIISDFVTTARKHYITLLGHIIILV